MESALSFVIGLLTAALSLLGLVEKHPELPQESREQAQQVAEQAITQAAQALADTPSPPAAQQVAEQVVHTSQTCRGFYWKNGTKQFKEYKELEARRCIVKSGVADCFEGVFVCVGGVWQSGGQAACTDVYEPACGGLLEYPAARGLTDKCAKLYVPVCGAKISSCETCTRDLAKRKTYLNKCFMEADGATLVYGGTCGDIPSPTDVYKCGILYDGCDNCSYERVCSPTATSR